MYAKSAHDLPSCPASLVLTYDSPPTLATCVSIPVSSVCSFKFDAMHAVTGAYAKRVFVEALGAPLVSSISKIS